MIEKLFSEQEGELIRRDPFGDTPLYYSGVGKDRAIISNQVRELLGAGAPCKLDVRGLHAYLAYGCLCSPLTLVDGIRAIPAGHALSVDKGKLSVKRYWQPEFTTKTRDERDVQDAVNAALRASISQRMRNNGNTVSAAFLSGGIDSSAIVAIMRQVYDGEIRTYCVRHDDDKTEESAWAQRVANVNKTKHTTLHLTDGMIRENIITAISSYDQPTVDGLNFWFASKLVREAGEEAIFSGEGGDELFAGYNRFRKNMMAYSADAKTRALGSAVWGGVIGGALERFGRSERIRKLGALIQGRSDPYSLPRRIFGESQIRELLRPELYDAFYDFHGEIFNEPVPSKDDLINRVSWLELQTVTTDMWLRDGYQTSTVHGLNVITPLLEEKLAELLFTIPGKMKVTAEYQKPLLVRAAGAGLPMECVTRGKMGFSLPFDRYFSGDLKEMLREFFEGGNSLLFRPKVLQKIWRDYKVGRVNWSRVWALFVVEYWCKFNKISV